MQSHALFWCNRLNRCRTASRLQMNSGYVRYPQSGRPTMNRYLRSGWSARVLTVLIPGASLCPMLFGQGSVQYGVFYMCPQGNRLKVFSCSGNEPGSTCDMQLFPGGQPGRRGPVSRGKVMPLIQQCHVQTAAEAQ